MSEERVYKCPLTIHIVKTSFDGRRVLSRQVARCLVQGEAGTVYSISYQRYLPAHAHLASSSPQAITGKVQVYQGQSFLSSNTDRLVYTADTGEIHVKYLNPTGQLVKSGVVRDDVGKYIGDVAQRVPLPNGYLYQRGQRRFVITENPQPAVIHVEKPHSRRPVHFRVIIERVTANGAQLEQSVHQVRLTKRVGDHFTVRPDTYRPPHFRSAKGNQPLRVLVTDTGTQPTSARFTYVKKTVAQQVKSTLAINYVNQHGSQVGNQFVRDMTGPALRRLLNQLRIPQGYYLLNHQAGQARQHRATLNVRGLPVSHQRAAFQLKMIVKDSTGKIVRRIPRQVHLAGRVGDRFVLQASVYAPKGLWTPQQSDIHGTFTAAGAHASSHTFVYLQPRRSSLRVRYLDPNGRVIKQQRLTGRAGQQVAPVSQVAVPVHYSLVANRMPRCQFTSQPRKIDLEVVPTAASAQANHGSATAGRSSSAASTSSATAPARSGNGESAPSGSTVQQGQPRTTAKPDPIKQNFLRRYYQYLFGGLTPQTVPQPVTAVDLGTRLADRYIAGIDDARRGNQLRHQRLRSYRYGYQAFQHVCQPRKGQKRITLTGALLKIIRLLLQRFIALNPNYYASELE